MKSLLQNSRFYILLGSFGLSFFLYELVASVIPSSSLQMIRLEQLYALCSVVFLYISILPTPLYQIFPNIPFKTPITHARRATGVSACYFGLLHALINFKVQLGGVSGLGFLSNSYLIALSLGLFSLIILGLLSLLSFDRIVEKMTFAKWKVVQRLIYLAGFGILLHSVMLGSHFITPSSAIPQTLFLAVSFLFILEAIRFDIYIQKRFSFTLNLGITLFLTSILLCLFFIQTNVISEKAISLGLHASHIELAKQLNQTRPVSTTIPGLTGDRNLRYTVSIDKPESILANEDTQLRFSVFNASNGNPIGIFQTIYEKPMHMIVVNNDLSFFSHIHPLQSGYRFAITTQFPNDDRYRIYLDYQPVGAIEQQVAFTIPVGTQIPQKPVHTTDLTKTKVIDGYEISLSFASPLKATEMTLGQSEISFTITDAKTKKPVTTLQPYLASFGHLVMINSDTYDYIHVHPSNLRIPKKTDLGGPTVSFLPIGIYGPFKKGTYRLFAQFNPDGKIITADFTIKVL